MSTFDVLLEADEDDVASFMAIPIDNKGENLPALRAHPVWIRYLERLENDTTEVMPSTFHRHDDDCWTTEPVLMTMPGSVGKVKMVQCAALRALPQNPQWSLFVASDVGYDDAAD